MNTNDNPQAEAKSSTVLSEKLKMVMGGFSILVFLGLAGLVYRQYEAGVPPADDTIRLVHVTISGQTLDNEMGSVPRHASHAAPAPQVSSTKRHVG